VALEKMRLNFVQERLRHTVLAGLKAPPKKDEPDEPETALCLSTLKKCRLIGVPNYPIDHGLGPARRNGHSITLSVISEHASMMCLHRSNRAL
jgi:hypothetical protein